MKSSTFQAGARGADPAASDAEAAAAPSKSQRKREMLELQQLGEQLARLSRARIQVLDVPDSLRQALLEHAQLRSFEGRRRHAQYIGKLMRQVDPAPLQQALLDATGDSRSAVARMHALEDWRARLLDDDAALAELAREHAGAASQELRQCIRAARAERAAGKPPRHARALYQHLKELFEAADHDADPDPDADLPS